MDTFDNLTKYKIILSAAENKSISKAAAQLYISQPAVSMTIKKLEQNLNTTLFIRNSKGVELTERGKLLYDSVKKAFHMLSDVEKSLKYPPDTGYLRIASSNVLCRYFLMPYLKEFSNRYPNTDLSITCTSSAEACVMIEECSCKNDEIFKYANIMLLDKDNVSRRHINAYYAKNNIIPLRILEANEMGLLIEFAKMGIGVSCVVKQFVERELETGCLIEISLSDPIVPCEIGFLYQEIQPFNENILKFMRVQSRKHQSIERRML